MLTNRTPNRAIRLALERDRRRWDDSRLFIDSKAAGKPHFLYCRASKDGGATWSDSKGLSDDESGDSAGLMRRRGGRGSLARFDIAPLGEFRSPAFLFLDRRMEEYGLSDRQPPDAGYRAVDSRVVLVGANDCLHHFWSPTR